MSAPMIANSNSFDISHPTIRVDALDHFYGEGESRNQVLFDNVLVPKENLVGEKIEGWRAPPLRFPTSAMLGAVTIPMSCAILRGWPK